MTVGNMHAINLGWLLRLRWGSCIGQAATILLVDWWFDLSLPIGALFTILAVAMGTNCVATGWLRRSSTVPEWVLGLVLAIDIVILTALLYFSGGSFNPFNSLYLVYIALAAVVLSARWTWALVALSAGCFGVLFVEELLPSGEDHLSHASLMQIHLQGMWVAFGVAAVFIVYFVHRIRNAVAERDHELAAIRERTARSERLASLVTLAAGAAHELATPLGTIAIVARELEETLGRGVSSGAAAADARVIREQVARCREILQQMSTHAGQSSGEAPQTVPLTELLHNAAAGARAPERVSIHIADDEQPRVVTGPREALVKALRGLIDNAQQASPSDAIVAVAVPSDPPTRIEVRDEGSGMAADVLERACEPFFTTKEPGEGMGLGLFLTNTLMEELGGSLEIESSPNDGTCATLVLPTSSNRDDLPHPQTTVSG